MPRSALHVTTSEYFPKMFYFLQFHRHSIVEDFVLMSVEVESDYQKSSWLKSLFRAV